MLKKNKMTNLNTRKKELLKLVGVGLTCYLGLPSILKLVSSSSAIIVFYTGAYFAFFKSIQSFSRSFYKEKSITLSMSYEEKTKRHRFNKGAEILIFIVITIIAIGSISLVVVIPTIANAISGIFAAWVIILLQTLKILWSFIKGSD